jgi:hypothetical protein
MQWKMSANSKKSQLVQISILLVCNVCNVSDTRIIYPCVILVLSGSLFLGGWVGGCDHLMI